MGTLLNYLVLDDGSPLVLDGERITFGAPVYALEDPVIIVPGDPVQTVSVGSTINRGVSVPDVSVEIVRVGGAY